MRVRGSPASGDRFNVFLTPGRLSAPPWRDGLLGRTSEGPLQGAER
jgi:hypothetical protein